MAMTLVLKQTVILLCNWLFDCFVTGFFDGGVREEADGCRLLCCKWCLCFLCGNTPTAELRYRIGCQRQRPDVIEHATSKLIAGNKAYLLKQRYNIHFKGHLYSIN